MSDNPLEVTPEREQRIRERAYHLWQADGEPRDRDLEYRERARELVGLEESAGAGLEPNPQTHPGRQTIAPGVTVEEAAIQENLGEFPDRFADQGDRPATPEPRHARAQSGAQGDNEGGDALTPAETQAIGGAPPSPAPRQTPTAEAEKK